MKSTTQNEGKIMTMTSCKMKVSGEVMAYNYGMNLFLTVNPRKSRDPGMAYGCDTLSEWALTRVNK